MSTLTRWKKILTTVKRVARVFGVLLLLLLLCHTCSFTAGGGFLDSSYVVFWELRDQVEQNAKISAKIREDAELKAITMFNL